MDKDTSDLYNKVLEEYKTSIDKLTFSDKYHFLHHLYLWERNDWVSGELASIKRKIVGDKATVLKRMTRQLAPSAVAPVKNAAQLRQKYIVKYPAIRPLNGLLLEVLYMKTVFGVDSRSLIPQVTHHLDIPILLRTLLTDSRAIAFLSTYAVNFFYIYYKFYAKTESFEPVDILRHVDILDKNNPQELLLYFYFVTHCIIGDSLFYAKPISDKYLQMYQSALRKLDEILMSGSYNFLHMDVKFETVVCARMCGLRLKSEAKIYSEALQSLSADGNFIVDIHNKATQEGFKDLSSSEHRNILFLMSCKDYEPRYSVNDF